MSELWGYAGEQNILNTKRYIVFQCRQCGLPTYCRSDHKSRCCSRCGYVNPVCFSKVRVIGFADDCWLASEMVKQAKVRSDLFRSYHTRTQTHTINYKRQKTK